MLIPIVQGRNDTILRTVSKPVNEVTKKTHKFLRDMEDTMFEAKGVGIAAPQVGVNDRIFLALLDQERVVAMINPEIVEYSVGETITMEEGCLSLPGHWAETARYKSVTVKYTDEKGHERTMKLNGFNARIIQHELDHLNGMLFVDRIDAEDYRDLFDDTQPPISSERFDA